METKIFMAHRSCLSGALVKVNNNVMFYFTSSLVKIKKA